MGVWFQVHCPPLVGVLPIVRSRYWCAIGRRRVLSLGRWSSPLRAHLHVLGPTQDPARPPTRRLRGSHPLRPAIPRRLTGVSGPNRGPTTPGGTRPPGLGWSPFARRYLGSRCCFPLLGVLRCFSSPRWLGHPGINARLAAPPGLSRPPAPLRLPAPRHPPHALCSLATPPHAPTARRPRGPGPAHRHNPPRTSRGGDDSLASKGLVSNVRSDETQASSDATSHPPRCQRSSTRSASPRSWPRPLGPVTDRVRRKSLRDLPLRTR